MFSEIQALSSHAANSMPVSSIPMVQQVQQHQPIAQMYPQVHVSHYANLMPYRHVFSPVYVPPMAMPGYSSNAAYPHPPNGSNYLLMPGGGSHLSANGLKYGIQQFKPVPTGSASGFGNFTSPTGYAINTPGVIGSATGLKDSSRMKYKDGNLYVPNPQVNIHFSFHFYDSTTVFQSLIFMEYNNTHCHTINYLPQRIKGENQWSHRSIHAIYIIGQIFL